MLPLSEYYVGYAELTVDRKDDINEAKNGAIRFAKIDLVESIKVSIVSSTESFVNEKVTSGTNNKLNTDFLSDFRTNATMAAHATLDGLKKYNPVYDKKTHKVYALAYVNKKGVLMKQKEIFDMNLKTIESNYSQATHYKNRSEDIVAIQKLSECDGHFKIMDDAQGMIITIEGKMYKHETYLKNKSSVDLLYTEISDDSLKRIVGIVY